MRNSNMVVILNNIRSNENVGSIFRTADASGVSKIILTGYTPAPLDKFGRKNKALSKSALGAEEFVEWEKVKNLKTAISNLKTKMLENVSVRSKIVAVEQDKKAVDYKDYKLPSTNYNLALVFGNEVTGLSQNDLKLCDEIIEIPMKGSMVRQAHHPRNIKRGKESLNVAVAAGVILFSLECSLT